MSSVNSGKLRISFHKGSSIRLFGVKFSNMFLFQRRLSHIPFLARYYALIIVALSQVAVAGKSDVASGRAVYSYGQPMPVTCLNRTM